jgi:hypothetical protein
LREVVRASPDDLRKKRAELAALEKKIDTGAERFLTAPAAMSATIGAKLEQWRTEKDALVKVVASLQSAASCATDATPLASAVCDRLEDIYMSLVSGDDEAKREVYRVALEYVKIEWTDRPYWSDLGAKRAAKKGKEYRPSIRSEVACFKAKFRPDAFTVRTLISGVLRLEKDAKRREGELRTVFGREAEMSNTGTLRMGCPFAFSAYLASGQPSWW